MSSRSHLPMSRLSCPGKGCPDQITEADAPQIPIEQLQPRVRGELRLGELESQIPIDTSMQIGVSSSHCRWPFVRGWRFGWHLTFNHNERPFSMRPALLSAKKLSDQG